MTLANGVTVRVICGEVAGVRGPVENIVIDPQYLDISVPAKTRFTFPTPLGYTVFAYVIDGKATFCYQNRGLITAVAAREQNSYDETR